MIIQASINCSFSPTLRGEGGRRLEEGLDKLLRIKMLNSTELRPIPARENPFATFRTDSLAFRFPTGQWSENLKRLAALRYRAAIVGPQGTGKTTLLHELSLKLLDLGFKPVFARANVELVESLLSNVEPNQIILLDSAEQLPRPLWWKLVWRTRERCGLVVTVHRRCLLPNWVQCNSSPALARYLLRELGLSDLDAATLASAFKRHRGNIRDLFRSLYDDFASGKLT